MNSFKLTCFSAFLMLSALPTFAFADLIVANDTNAPVTGHLKVFCSSVASTQGIIQPHQTIVVPQSTFDKIDFLCSHGCDVDVYATDNCKGAKIATVEISKTAGISNIRNSHANGYYLAGGGFKVAIEGTAARKWYHLFLF
ncbi:MAG: hypothetical protein A3E85_05185 [Gammaproteobacteria bacterium RIFCSPHIGHO2_12_FULL_45_12]|nr:MAG: hypothetical protein A3E85_05185 [Gammaproteobacteria bacterium RIFCSPHIGHO2_12_FULL_45_12]